MRVAVIGGAGFVGGELLRLLLQHPDVTELTATSRSQAGQPLAAVHPGLAGMTDARFAGDEAGMAAAGCDVVFLALEHGESSRVIESVYEAGPGIIVDLAADFRVSDLRLYERYYGPHGAPAYAGRFTYALADVLGPALLGKTALAVPGCFATAAQLALYPLSGLETPVEPSLFAITGSSGSGNRPRPTTHHPLRANNVFAYSPLHHRHDAEILQRWREWTGRPDAEARLLTHSGPFVRGIYLTLHARHVPPGMAERYRTTYAARPFVRVMDEPVQLTHAAGTNYALIHVTESKDGREIEVNVAIDNLVKGAGGQGVQAMNLALGIDETAGLRGGSPFPV